VLEETPTLFEVLYIDKENSCSPFCVAGLAIEFWVNPKIKHQIASTIGPPTKTANEFFLLIVYGDILGSGLFGTKRDFLRLFGTSCKADSKPEE
jgi:hypothetical protein